MASGKNGARIIEEILKNNWEIEINILINKLNSLMNSEIRNSDHIC